MRISDGPRVITKQASSPRQENDETGRGDGSDVHYKKAKFKSPVSLRATNAFQTSQSSEQIVIKDCSSAHSLISENQVVSSFEACNGNGGRKHIFGTDASNIQFVVEDKNHSHTGKRIAKSLEYSGNGMPGFGGILDDICQICPDVAVKVEHSDGGSDEGENTTLQSSYEGREADNKSVMENNSHSEEDQASCDIQRDKARIGARVCRGLRASAKGPTYSQFRMPARVVGICKAPEASEMSGDVSGRLARPQLFHTPYRSSTTSTNCGKVNGDRWKVEKIQSEYYCVMYCIRKPNAKHKGPWSDGVLIRRGRSFVLQDTEGKVVLQDGEQRSGALADGATLLMGKFEVEVTRRSTEEEFLNGNIFLGAIDVPCDAIVEVIKKRAFKSFRPPTLRVSINAELSSPLEIPTAEVKPAFGKQGLVLNASDLRGASVPVTVDAYLALKLRPHQREGVKFMYECVMGLRNPSFTGCLLADAMGLGKTLQVIALIWTLIKQGPGGHPAVQRVLVICPSSLVENWGKEVRKWLGNERLTPLIIHSGTSAKDVKRKLSSFQIGKMYHLLITSYELLRKHKDDLTSAKPGLLVCDEAHRLKNCAGNKTIDSLLELNCSKRLILTGTPVQNDLLEFYAMIDFVNPTLLGPLLAFKRLYANPIERSRDRDASEGEKILGRARSAELQSMTRFCILQRAADVNSMYLPAKTEFVVFCKLQPLQALLYQNFLKSKLVSESLASGKSAFVLSAIGTLRKLCNHPRLVDHDLGRGNGNMHGMSSGNKDDLKALLEQTHRRTIWMISLAHNTIPPEKKERSQAICQPVNLDDGNCSQDRTSVDWRLSGKLSCLQRLLSAVHDSSCTKDKMVVVSNFTQTLDIIQILCEGQAWRWLRLDGTTAVSERQALVDRFNSNHEERVFLLSSKAGGSGLNLIGANRLVLFDPDWNPATDAQAMARVWRDGQKKVVFIYRLLTTASIEEKIYQRQIMKGEVAAAVEEQTEGQFEGGEGGGRRHFSREELRELFTLDLETSCDTYDLLLQSESSCSERWRDYSKEVEDHALKEAIQTGVVTFVYQNIYKHDIISSLGNAREDGVHSRLEEWTGALDSNKSDFSSFSSEVLIDEVDERVLDRGQQIANPTIHCEDNSITCFENERLQTDVSSSAAAKKENAKDSWDAQNHDISSLASDVFVDKMDELPLEYDEQSACSSHREQKRMRGPEGECLPTNCSTSTLSTRDNDADEIRDAKRHGIAADVFDNVIGELLVECDEHIASPIHWEHKGTIIHKNERFSEKASSSAVCTRDNDAKENWDAKKHEVSSAASGVLGDKVDELRVESDETILDPFRRERQSITGLENERLEANDSISIVSGREKDVRENWVVEKHDLYIGKVNGLPLQCDEQIVKLTHGEHDRTIRPGKEYLSANDSTSKMSKSESNTEDKLDAWKHNLNTDSGWADFSSSPIQVTSKLSDCLLESRGQKILKLMVDLPAPDDEVDVDELELLDAPFLCSLDLEMEMKRANFAPEDLWQGFKLFAVGYLWGAKEERLLYRNSKLGLVLDKCNLDHTTDDESIFCKGIPLVQAVISRRDGHQAADVSYLFDAYEREEQLRTTSTGRFIIDLMRLIDTHKTTTKMAGLL